MTGVWEPSLNAIDELSVMLVNVEWGKELHGMEAQNIYECAAWVKDSLVGNPFGTRGSSRDKLKLIYLVDAVLDWVAAPQDQDLINRVHKAAARWANE